MIFQRLGALSLRAMRSDLRSPIPNVLRTGIIAWTGLALVLAMERSWYGAPGLQLFQSVVLADGILLALLGVGYFSNRITEEKEDGTLGLMRMAGLNAVSILLGKSVGLMLTSFMLLAAQIPFVLMAITLGGVSIDQVMFAVCLLGSQVIWISGLGVFFSTLMPTARMAAGATLLALLASWSFPLMRSSSFPFLSGMFTTVFDVLGDLSVWSGLGSSLTSGFMGGWVGSEFWTAIAAGGLCYLAAFCIFDRCADMDGMSPLLRRNHRERRSRVLSPVIGVAAIRHKDIRFTFGGARFILWRLLLYCLIFWVIAQTLPVGVSPSVLGWVLLSIGLWTMLLEYGFALENSIHAEVAGKTLSSLVALPYSTGSILREKLIGCSWVLLPGAIFFLVGALCAPDNLSDFLDHALDEPVLWVMVSLILLVYTFTIYFALCFRRGAFVLALLLVFLIAATLISGMQGGSGSGLWLLAFMIGGGCALMVPVIQLRFEVMAGR